MDELQFSCALARAPRLNAAMLCNAAAAVGGLAALGSASEVELLSVGLSEAAARYLAAPDPAQLAADLAVVERLSLSLLPITAANFPSQLATIPSPPCVLYVRGNVAALCEPQLAIVGSRHPTAAGRRTARDFAFWFADHGVGVTSGLALGIDAASHEGALAAKGLTIAVCATGLDCVYPTANTALAERIAGSGALVSEFPPGTLPLPAHFPQRNRLISGLSMGTLVVEAAERSGSLITARYALEQGRDVFAIPGSIHSPTARGCHRLLKAGATLVESAADVLRELQFLLASQQLAAPEQPLAPALQQGLKLDKDYEILLDALGFTPTGVDALVESTGLAGSSVASMLLMLELQGLVESSPGGRYNRIGAASLGPSNHE